MFEIGLSEIAAIAGASLLLFRPRDLPKLSRDLGRALRGFRSKLTDMTGRLGIDDNVTHPLRELRAALQSTKIEVEGPVIVRRPGLRPLNGVPLEIPLARRLSGLAALVTTACESAPVDQLLNSDEQQSIV
jgi:Sec-independent protein translocase protein TatA